MRDRQWLLDRQERLEREQRQWQAEESRLNREHQARLTKASDEIQADMANATRKAARFQLIGLLVATGAIIVGVISNECGGDDLRVALEAPTSIPSAQP